MPVSTRYGLPVPPGSGVVRMPIAPVDAPVNEAAVEKLISPGMMLLHATRAAEAQVAALAPTQLPPPPAMPAASSAKLTMASILFDMRSRAAELRSQIASADAARVELDQLERMIAATGEKKE